MSQKIKVDQIADLSATAAQLNFTVGVTASIQTQIDAKLPKTGGAMTGAITTNSTFDGRDVGADGTKLDGIEAGATTDQTASEIRAKVESATDSNVFTDADHSKLNGIEASADVTDAGNVNPLVDAHLNQNTASSGEILSWNGSDYDWISAGGAGDLQASNNLSDVANATTSRANLGLAIGSNVQAYSSVLAGTTASYTTALNTKLAGIEASADVTDAANVTAAGALMDSEVDADIKTLSLPANTTISAYGATLVDDANAAASRTTLGLGTAATTASTDYATAAQGTTADAALPKTGGAMTGAITTNSTFDGRDVAADGTKLDGIEASADVTDTANVVSALTAGTGITIAGNGTIASTVTATTSASDLTSGTLPDARFPATLPAISGANLTNLPAGLTGTTTTSNTALGVSALASVTAGTNRNVAIGEKALQNVTSGTYHTAVGYEAGVGQTTGQFNTFLGTWAGRGATATGDGNVAIGYTSLGFYSRTSATRNVAIGYAALNDITTGNENIAAGYQAAEKLTTGSNNLTLGTASGAGLTTPSSNVFLGENSGQYATTASSNICIGTYAGSYASSGTSRLSTGTYNIIIGGYAGDKITTETNNICIGHHADNYDTGISNRITLGNSSITSLRIPGIQSGATNGQLLTYNSGSGGYLELADAPASSDATKMPLAGGTFTGNVSHADSVYSYWGASNDLQIAHTGGTNRIQSGNTSPIHILGDIEFSSSGGNGGDVLFRGATTGQDMLWDRSDNALELADNTSLKIGTTNGGCTISGTAGGSTQFLASSNDLLFKSNGNFYFRNASNSDLIRTYATGVVELFHNGTKKLETSSSGVSVTGTLAATAVTGDGSGLTGIATGATGGGSDQIFYENGQSVTTNYTITSNKNAVSAGPITIASGVTVTVPSGSRWAVV